MFEHNPSLSYMHEVSVFRNRKKLEKALTQAKDDVQMMSEKLLVVSKGRYPVHFWY